MIQVTRLDGSRLVVNADQIEFVEARPDTVISFISDKKIIVREPPSEIINLVVAFRKRIMALPPTSSPAEA